MMKTSYLLFILLVLLALTCLESPVQADQGNSVAPGWSVMVAQYAAVIIYGVEGCSHTLAARKDHPGHIFYDVRKDPKRMKELESLTGGKHRWPVLVKGNQVIMGYGGT
jgi:hypothetical protein